MHRLSLALCVAAWLLAATGASPAAEHAVKGVALVIGETDYVRLPTLANPDKDARDIDHMLDDLGFDVSRVLDADTPTIRSKIDSFLSDAKGADVALVYYAGHGIEAGGTDYIMGTNADIADASSASATLVSLDDLLARLQKTVPITIVLLDACRTNPFTGQQTLELAGAASPLPIADVGLEVVRGPTPVNGNGAQSTSLGVVVGFSASPGQSALDGPPGANSPYAAALLQHLGAGGYSFGDVMTLVSQEVYVDTGARQLPWTSSSLSRVLYFGRDADAPTGDDAQILDDRRKLLLDIATVPVQSKAYVEAVAAQEDLKLADLYSMLEIINSGKADVSGGSQQSLLDVAKRVRDVLDDPILAGAPTDPELARLDGLAGKAIAAGAFKLAFGYRQQEARRAAAIEKGLDAQQADIDAQRKELAGVYARVAEAAMYNLDTAAETDAYQRAAKQSDLFDKSVSIRLRLRSANALADKAGTNMDLHSAQVAIALYQDILKQVDKTALPSTWADVQLRMGETMWEAANRQGDHSLQDSAVNAAAAALKVFTPASDFRRWSEAERLLAEAMRDTGQTAESMFVLTKLLAVTGKETSPLDWAKDEEDLGNLYFDLGFSGSDTDTDLLTKAAAAFSAAATGYQRYDFGGYDYMLARQADARARVALRTGDRADLLSAIDAGRQALSLGSSVGKAEQGNLATMLGEDLAAAGELLDDVSLTREGLATLAKAERINTEKAKKVDWAQMRESDGDALSYLGKKAPRNAKLLAQAVVAYGEASEAFDEAGNWSDARARTRIKKIRLQQFLGQKISPGDIALANIPPPAALVVTDATASVVAMYASAQFEGFQVAISNATLDGKPLQLNLRVMTDYNSAGKIPSNLSLLRIAADTSGLGDPESQNANYGKCGEIAAQPGEFRLHYGKESALNSCILALMVPADAALWEAVWQDLPALIAKAAQDGNSSAARIAPLFAVKTVTSF